MTNINRLDYVTFTTHRPSVDGAIAPFATISSRRSAFALPSRRVVLCNWVNTSLCVILQIITTHQPLP